MTNELANSSVKSIDDDDAREMIVYPRAGDRFLFTSPAGNVIATVTRVSTKFGWADVRCVDDRGNTWVKRQPLVDNQMPPMLVYIDDKS